MDPQPITAQLVSTPISFAGSDDDRSAGSAAAF
jgi:hypothetical protein